MFWKARPFWFTWTFQKNSVQTLYLNDWIKSGEVSWRDLQHSAQVLIGGQNIIEDLGRKKLLKYFRGQSNLAGWKCPFHFDSLTKELLTIFLNVFTEILENGNEHGTSSLTFTEAAHLWTVFPQANIFVANGPDSIKFKQLFSLATFCVLTSGMGLDLRLFYSEII